MQCENSLGDLENLASQLFQFSSQQQQKAKRDRQVKKQIKKQKIENQQSKKQQIQDDDEVNFNFPIQNKLPGTHSIYVKTFGCSHNISDSEFMIGQLVDYGYHMVNSVQQADLVLINSCTVKNPSQDAFLSMVCKAKKIKKPVVVAGCVPQGDQGIPQLAEISALGVTQIDRVVEVVEETLKGHKVQLMDKKELPSLDLPKIRKNKDIEIIPINAGCLGACTYCKTVFARGKLLSYAPEAITGRVNNVVKEGVKQIWLTSQDTGAYGRDIGSNISQLLISLCSQLQNHDNLMIRLGMTNPPYMLDHLRTIAHFLNHPRVFSFVHVPVQAGHNNVLSKMNRQYTVQQFRKVCDFFLENVPDVTIATDIICGFAQETDQEFQGTLHLIDHYKFRVVNINQFYLRPGTPAANLKQLPSKIIKQRSSKLTQLFKSYNKFEYLLGKEERVWINQVEDYKNEKHLVGHTKNYTKVIIPYQEELLYKQVIIKVNKIMDWHIEGEIINKNVQSLKVDPNYADKMKQDILNEKLKLEQKHAEKLEKLKQKKQKYQQSINTKTYQIPQKVQKVQKSEKNNKLENNEQIKERKLSKPDYFYLVLAIIFFIIAAGLHLIGY